MRSRCRPRDTRDMTVPVRDAQNRGGLRVGVALDVGVVHRRPEAVRQGVHRRLDLVVGQRIQHLCLGGARPRRQSRGAIGQVAAR